jgi:hypothetical protein
MRALLRKLPYGAQVAQLVEQRTENPRVGGSIPPLGTIPPSTWKERLRTTFAVESDATNDRAFWFQIFLWKTESFFLLFSRVGLPSY